MTRLVRLCTSAIIVAGVSLAQNTLRMNEIQVIGTHNSYHVGIAPSESKLMIKRAPKTFDALDYHHAPLADQLSGGVRQIELDVFADTKGGLFAHPLGPQNVKAAGLPADPPYDPDGLMAKPEPFTAATFDALDAEIRSVFDADEMITPDQVRGEYDTLNEAILKRGWPSLDDARGKVVFLMDQRPMGPVYLEGHPSLRGRVIFTNAVPGTPDAAFVEQNDGAEEAIAALVKQGYLIRTRSDSETRQARTNDTTRRDIALRSGAQMISTDYPASEPSSWTGYSVSLPDHVAARCNPVLKPKACPSGPLEPAGER